MLQTECECEQRLGGRRASRVTPRGQRWEEEGGREGVDGEAGEESGGLRTLESENQTTLRPQAPGPKSRSH